MILFCSIHFFLRNDNRIRIKVKNCSTRQDGDQSKHRKILDIEIV
jgi:hypothetical protein